jgi:hypothetical protein
MYHVPILSSLNIFATLSQQTFVVPGGMGSKWHIRNKDESSANHKLDTDLKVESSDCRFRGEYLPREGDGLFSNRVFWSQQPELQSIIMRNQENR